MATTFELFAKAQIQNYCTKPTIDVDVLPTPENICGNCSIPVHYDMKLHKWLHADENNNCSFVTLRSRCKYCNATDTISVVHHNWYDEYKCSRCGGAEGYAIGD